MPFLRRGLATLALVLLAARPAAAVLPAGGVYVTTLPSAADVWIDGTYVGRSPVLVDALAPGRHGVTLTRTGWQSRTISVQISGGGVAMSGTRLSPTLGPVDREGTFVVRGVRPRKVVLDGRPLFADATRPVSAAAGRHTIAVALPQGRMTREFVVVPRTETEVVLHDAPVAHAARAAVDAPAAEYLPSTAYFVIDRRVSVRYDGHEIDGRLGDLTVRYDGVATTYESAPAVIGGRLYLPLDLLQRIAARPATTSATGAPPSAPATPSPAASSPS